MGKDKLRKFAEIDKLNHVIQPKLEEVLEGSHPWKGNWGQQLFGNDNPITLELGCGKGEYTLGLARMFPDRNFIGMDIKGARIWRGAKGSLEDNLPNVAFIRSRIDFISHLFESREISEIWITFPDPQPQTNRRKKRLTSTEFLERYRKVLVPGGTVNLKTDSRFFYDFTLEVIANDQLILLGAWDDIYGLNQEVIPKSTMKLLEIKTYYEKKWLAEGRSVNFLTFKP